MTPQQIWQMLLKASPMLASGLLIGAWFAIQYPDIVKTTFNSPAGGLVALLLSIWIHYKNDTEVNNQINTLKASITTLPAILTMSHWDDNITAGGDWIVDWAYSVVRINEIKFTDSMRTESQNFSVTFLVTAY